MKVLFACVHNAGRSQMAAAMFNKAVDRNRGHAISAGTVPAARVHPVVVEALREVGIDMSTAVPQLLTDELARDVTLLVTMGCGEACPHVPGLRREDWPLADPNGEPLERVREIRDEISRRVDALIRREGLRRVVLRAEYYERGSRHLSAWQDERGLHIDGQDLGEGTESIGTDGEYEWSYTVKPEHLPRLRASLAIEGDLLDALEREWSGARSYDFEKRLRDVPTEFWSG